MHDLVRLPLASLANRLQVGPLLRIGRERSRPEPVEPGGDGGERRARVDVTPANPGLFRRRLAIVRIVGLSSGVGRLERQGQDVPVTIHVASPLGPVDAPHARVKVDRAHRHLGNASIVAGPGVGLLIVGSPLHLIKQEAPHVAERVVALRLRLPLLWRLCVRVEAAALGVGHAGRHELHDDACRVLAHHVSADVLRPRACHVATVAAGIMSLLAEPHARKRRVTRRQQDDV